MSAHGVRALLYSSLSCNSWGPLLVPSQKNPNLLSEHFSQLLHVISLEDGVGVFSTLSRLLEQDVPWLSG